MVNLRPRYIVGRELGRGGMGIVYEADDARLGRKVAVKVLHAGPDTADRKRRFAQEAKAASALNHPNIVTIHDIDVHDDVDFIVMELLDGVPLSRAAHEGPLPLDRVIDYAIQIASALAASHAANIVHRDLKPANVMVTGGDRIKVLDFGLSKWTVAPVSDDAATATAVPHTQAGAIVGTTGYMSPEQALGRPVDTRSDVFSFGVVLYELLAGQRAFTGDSQWAAMNALVHEQPKPLMAIRPDVPGTLAAIVNRCLEKDPVRRYPSGVELLADLQLIRASASTRPAATARYLAGAAAVLLAVVIAGAWVVVRRWQNATMVERTIPEIEHLAGLGQYVEAYRLGQRAARTAPGDPRVQRAVATATVPLNMNEPVGADVYFKDYGDVDGPSQLAGRIPIKDVRVPMGELRWKIVKAGFDPAEGSSPAFPLFTIRPAGEAPTGMVYVSGGRVQVDATIVQLPDFWIDKYEVTNREFKRFIDSGGYRDSKFWKEPFAGDGVRSFEDALSRFVDKTGRPGPATWELGTYPEGQAEYPVSGISWYEAAAYAEFAGKRLPTVFHWKLATGNMLFGQVVASMGNFNAKSAEPPARLKDLGAFGTYGLAGNVKEWVENAADDRRFLVGGAWNDPPYMAANREPRSPLDRHETHGVRCVRDLRPVPPAALAPVAPSGTVARFDKPVGDDLYAVYKALYAYDHGPLDAHVEPAGETEHWRAELVSIAAAYGRERVPLYVVLPKNAAPPYQAVVWFPGGYAFGLFPLGRDLGDAPGASFFTFLPRAGRALVFPIYQGTFQRFAGVGEFPRDDQMNAYRDMVVQWSKDLGRTIDYLETRSDIDAGRVGYYGGSAGANAALPIVAVEPRLKAVVLLSGGLPAIRRPPEADPINFAPHITAPTLMLNGRDDFIFPLESVAKPLFTLLGAPPGRKRLAIHEGGHVPALNELIRDVLGWFDQYLGPVQTK
jgi:formylglycine-generating enzyme required for sulfatase activity/dienelactone hydrolase